MPGHNPEQVKKEIRKLAAKNGLSPEEWLRAAAGDGDNGRVPTPLFEEWGGRLLEEENNKKKK